MKVCNRTKLNLHDNDSLNIFCANLSLIICDCVVLEQKSHIIVCLALVNLLQHKLSFNMYDVIEFLRLPI